MPNFKIVRFFAQHPDKRRVVRKGLTEEQAQEHCNDPETSSTTCTNRAGKRRTRQYGDWFEGYTDR